nr:hypothetical protein [Luteolibacter marinus]
MIHAFDSPSPSNQTATRLGYSVAIDGGIVAVGAPWDDSGSEDSGVVWIHDSATGALTHRLENPSPLRQSHFGSSVAVSGSRVIVGVPEDNTGENDAGIVYVYDLNSPTPAVPVLTLNNPMPDENDLFGWAVALSGDSLIVGAPGGDFGTTDAGCAYLYDLASGTPSLPARQLANPNPAGKNFGHSVAIEGSSWVVGSIQNDGSGDACRAFVYDGSSGTPGVPVLTLADPSPGSNDHFGYSVSLAGSRVVISAPLDDTGAINSGAAYVFDLAAEFPAIPRHSLFNPTPANEDAFGGSVAVSGDTVIVGAGFDDGIAEDSGRAYLFNLLAVDPDLPESVIYNPDPQSGDKFGAAVSMSGTRLVVGAYEDRTVAKDAGSAYVFELSSATPGQSLFSIANPSPSSLEEFGSAVAIHGDLVVAGSPHDDKGASNAGSVAVFNVSSSLPTQPVLVFDNPTPSTNDYFGNAVAISGNLVAVGADHEDTGASNAGVVYIYDVSSGNPTTPVRTLTNPTPQSSDEFGNAVAIEGQIVVIGCFQNKIGGVEAGSVYVYDLSGPTPGVPFLTLDNPAPGEGDEFGHSVAISGSLVVVGARLDDAGAVDSGSAFVYDLTSPTPTTAIFVLDNPSPVADDQFGFSVAVSGPYVLVGSPEDDTVASNAGAVHVYDLASDFPTTPGFIGYPGAGTGARFGGGLGISGTRFVVGAPDDDDIAPNGGACYVYELTSATYPTPAERLETVVQAEDDQFGFDLAMDGTRIVVGVPLFDSNTADRGAAYLFSPDPPSPELQVEQPPGTGLVGSGANIPFGNVPVGSTSAVQEVIVRNIGTAVLEVTAIGLLGGNEADFDIDLPALPVELEVDEVLVFQVYFVPASKGSLASSLRIESNAGTGNPFDISLTGQALSAEDDTDGDGVNDVAELQMESMGFDWQVNDEELIQIMQSGANALGLFSGSQLQEMNSAATLLPKVPGSDHFRLAIGVRSSSELSEFAEFPILESQVSVNEQGAAEFRFLPTEPSAFFRLEAHGGGQ